MSDLLYLTILLLISTGYFSTPPSSSDASDVSVASIDVETSSPSAGGSASAPSDTTNAGDHILFEHDWSRPIASGPSTFRYAHVMAPERLRVETDPDSPRGGHVAHFVVQPGDNVGGWSGERAEVAVMQDAAGDTMAVTPESGREFYGISVKVPEGWQPPQSDTADGAWGIFFQLHGPDELRAPPSLSLDLRSAFHLSLHGGALQAEEGSIEYDFTDGSLHPGEWVEFLLDISWSAEDDGAVAVWRRDAGEAAFKQVLDLTHVANLQYDSGKSVGEHYWKTGYYRSEGAQTHELWIGPIVRGTDRDAVIARAFRDR